MKIRVPHNNITTDTRDIPDRTEQDVTSALRKRKLVAKADGAKKKKLFCRKASMSLEPTGPSFSTSTGLNSKRTTSNLASLLPNGETDRKIASKKTM